MYRSAFALLIVQTLIWGSVSTGRAASDVDLPRAPKSVTRVAPVYPPDAYAIGMSGKALMALTLDATGHVTGIRTIREDPAEYHFGEAAAAALKQWTFPAEKAGDYQIAVNFAWEPPADLSPEATALPDCPNPVRIIPTKYPPDLKRAINARVVVSIDIDDKGKVNDVRVVQEDPKALGFGEAVMLAIRQWHFPRGKPQTCGGDYNFGEGPSALTPAEKKLPDAPKPITRVQPQYPTDAEAKELSGAVDVIVVIDETGRVNNARVSSENPPGFGFGDACATAVRGWIFPAGSAGKYIVTCKFLPTEGDDKPSVAVDSRNLPLAPAPAIGGEPRYPAKAKQQGIEGSADIAIQLDGAGHITNAALLKENPADMGFGAAAYEAVVRWRFSYNTPEGAYRVHIDFKLN